MDTKRGHITGLFSSTVLAVTRDCEIKIDVEMGDVLHVAGGEHAGIVVNRLADEKPNSKCDVALSFAVWLRSGDIKKQVEVTDLILIKCFCSSAISKKWTCW
ncbi:unnamed protein product [Gongylonema pulchrum]|uniref:TOBE_2 domain-containing protein n=1 Tax=Gongylonema pulchrum TaxID=637853 RepID=A0A183CZR6_9BILA|nr:unnamed protein product [Gongylonema pulchrum]